VARFRLVLSMKKLIHTAFQLYLRHKGIRILLQDEDYESDRETVLEQE
jgi:hypothetical protein